MQEQPNILRVKNFISSYEIAEINEWVESVVNTKMFGPGISPGHALWDYHDRLTTRNQSSYLRHPDFILRLSQRVREYVGVSRYPLIKKSWRRRYCNILYKTKR